MGLKRNEFPVARRFGKLPWVTTNFALPILWRTAAGQLVCAGCANHLPAEQVLAGRINYSQERCEACQEPMRVAV